MASTTSDGLPCYPAAPGPALFDDDDHHHQLYIDPAAAGASSFPATDAQEPQPPPPAAEPRKPRKRTRASRRAPTTVLSTDASNFRAMVQEFTGFPAPPFPPYLGPGVFFGAGPSASGGSAAGGEPYHQLLRPSPLKLSAAPHAPTNTTSFAHTLFANSDANPAAGAPPSLSSEFYSRFGPTLAAGAVPSYDERFAAAMEGGRLEHGHSLATPFLHAGDYRYPNHPSQ